jgi:hypothetical protein
LAETYLVKHRGLTPPFPGTLRYSPSVLHPYAGVFMPAMVAAVQAPDGRVIAVQVTYLRDGDGAKVKLRAARWMIGSLGSGAVRLAPASTVLGLAEGTEDALAAMQFSDCPSWATLGAARMHSVAVPDSVVELHGFCDDDEAGRKAARQLATTHQHRRRIVIHLPPAGFKDWGAVAEASVERKVA